MQGMLRTACRRVQSHKLSMTASMRSFSTGMEEEVVSPELQALQKKVAEVETALGAGKKVKTQYIDDLMCVCIKRGQYNLVTNLFLLFDEESYLPSGAEADAEAPMLNQPTPSLQSFLNVLTCCVLNNEEELCLQMQTLYENSPVVLSHFDGQHLLDQFAEDDVRRYILEDALLMDAEAIKSFIEKDKTAEPLLTTPVVLTILGCINTPKSAVRLVQNLSPTKLQYSHSVLVPAIQYALYAADRSDMISGFVQTLHSKQKAATALDKGVVSRMLDIAFYFQKTMHSMVCFDQFVSSSSNYDSLGEGLEVAEQYLTSEFDAKMEIPQHLYHLTEWLDSTCNDYYRDHIAENGEMTLFTKIGMLLLPNFHSLVKQSIAGVKFDHTVLPDDDQCNTIVMAMQGTPPTVWSLEKAVKPLFWKEMFFFTLFLAQQGRLDSEMGTFFLSCLVAAKKPAPTMYLLHTLYTNKIALDTDNSERIMQLLLREYVHDGVHNIGPFQYTLKSPLKVLTRLVLQTKPKDTYTILQYLSQCILHGQEELVLVILCKTLQIHLPLQLENTKQVYVSDKQQVLLQNSIKYIYSHEKDALLALLQPLHQFYRKSEYEKLFEELSEKLRV